MSPLTAPQRHLWRADVYRVLALALDTPTPTMIAQLGALLRDLLSTAGIDAAMVPALQQVGTALARERDGLAAEYTRLFVTETACPASEGSYHLAERGPVLGDVMAFYRAFRVQIHEGSGPPDTMKMELGFLHFMALKAAAAAEQDRADDAAVTEDATAKFLRDHVGRWTARFADRLAAATTRDFYHAVAALLTQWIAMECAAWRITPVPLPEHLESMGPDGCMGCATGNGPARDPAGESPL